MIKNITYVRFYLSVFTHKIAKTVDKKFTKNAKTGLQLNNIV